MVALRKESVDRNDICNPASTLPSVALRKESVDRNNRRFTAIDNAKIVALRKESVDRNIKEDVSYNIKETSLSARRAWIEINVT